MTMDVLDYPDRYPGSVSEEVEKQFQEHYLRPLGKAARYVLLESVFHAYMLGLHVNDLFNRNAHER